MFCTMTGSIVRISFVLLSVISIAACDSVEDAALPLNNAPVASSVSITDENGGAAVIGDSLTGNYIYSDEENDAEGTSIYRWLRNDSAIGGATASSYTLVALDAGQSITFEVTPVASNGTLNGSTITSPAIAVSVANSAPTASSVSITDNNGGSAVVGDILTGNYTYVDVDGDAEGTSTFRWLRNGAAINGATSLSYTMVIEDSTASITFEVTPIAATGETIGEAVTSSAIAGLNFPPIASSVSITDSNGGSVLLGDTLNGNYTYADAENDSEGATAFRWFRNATAIAGATSQNYTLVAADVAQSITFEVTPAATTGTILGASVSSPAITVTNSAPVASSVSISDNNGGTAVVGDNLTGNYSYNDLENDDEGISTFRWLRDGVAISGATSKSYTLVALDSGPSITFEVTPIALTGTLAGSPVTSGGITLNNSAPVASNVSITDNNGGLAVVGDILTGNYSYNDIDGDSEGSSTFRWRRNGTTTIGTALTYTLVAADSGATITFEVIPVAATGTTNGSAVVSATGITVNSAPAVSNVSITDDNGGLAVVGDGLTGSYSYSDIDGDSEGTSTFRWLRNNATTVSTTLTYTLVALDSGSNITFEVTPVAATGTTPGVAVPSAAISISNTAPVTSNVSITDNNGGSTVVGDTLTGSYSYSDIDGDSEGSSTFRWLRNGTTTIGTALTYTLVAADSGYDISFEVTPVAATGNLTGLPVLSSTVITVINSAPVANAGPDQTTPLVGETVTLDGSGSTDVDGDSLTYSWSILTVPGSSAVTTASLNLTDPVRPSFVVDVAGSYVVQLIVNDATVNSTPATVSISTDNSAPVADAGPDQTTPLVGETVTLDGSGSTDVDGDSLTYSWSILTVPGSSAVTTASLNLTDPVRPSFVVDVAGSYVVQLIVNDATVNSTPATVSISTDNSAPVADAGPDQTTPLVGETVTLDGSGSSDADNDTLTYSWSFTNVPGGSAVTTASLDLTDPVHPTFVVDVAGSYVVQLIVNDATVNSTPATVSISTGNSAPVADAGPNQTTPLVGETVTLDGSGSSDADNDTLTYSWSFTNVPGGSAVTTASLDLTDPVHPTFVTDVSGLYVVQLIVNDSLLGSVPVTVNITTAN